ncbi:MAG TPA: hypothetical protein VH253_02915 [Phycisphaerae bacterium]|nr:hypothetical protein [Phycisphaerae bacterium]
MLREGPLGMLGRGASAKNTAAPAQNDRFALESAGPKVSGSIISPSFRGIPDSERQRRIWDALHQEFGPDSVQRAGTFLAFTPDEWNLDADPNA